MHSLLQISDSVYIFWSNQKFVFSLTDQRQRVHFLVLGGGELLHQADRDVNARHTNHILRFVGGEDLGGNLINY
jgi:hypothetical protein